MKQVLQGSASSLGLVALGAVVLAAATGLAFASWIDNAPGIFMTLVDSGLSWCF